MVSLPEIGIESVYKKYKFFKMGIIVRYHKVLIPKFGIEKYRYPTLPCTSSVCSSGDPKKVVLMIHDVPRHFSPKFWCTALQIFAMGQKWVCERWCAGIKKTFQNSNYWS